MRTQKTAFGRLYDKQATFLQIFQSTGFDPAQKENAAKLAGYVGSTAPMKSGTVRELIARAMEKRGLTPDLLVRAHKEAIQATKIAAVIPEKTDGNGKIVQKKDVITVPDHVIRLRAVELGYDVLGAMPSKSSIRLEKHETFNFDSGTISRAEEVSGERILDIQVEPENLDDPNRPF
jgi:hypothetical protein